MNATDFTQHPDHQEFINNYYSYNVKGKVVHLGVMCDSVEYERDLGTGERTNRLALGIFGSSICCCLCTGFCDNTLGAAWMGKDVRVGFYYNKNDTERSYAEDEKAIGFNPSSGISIHNYLKTNGTLLDLNEAVIRSGGRRAHIALGKSYSCDEDDFYPYFRKNGSSCFLVMLPASLDTAFSVTCFNLTTKSPFIYEAQIVARAKHFIKNVYPLMFEMNNGQEQMDYLMDNGYVIDSHINEGYSNQSPAPQFDESSHLLDNKEKISYS